MKRQSSDGSCRPARHRWCRASGSPWPPTLDHRPNRAGRPTSRNHRRRPHQHRCTAPPDSKVYFQDAVAALRPCSRFPPRCRAVESHVRAAPSPTHPLFPFCVALHFASVPPDAHDLYTPSPSRHIPPIRPALPTHPDPGFQVGRPLPARSPRRNPQRRCR